MATKKTAKKKSATKKKRTTKKTTKKTVKKTPQKEIPRKNLLSMDLVFVAILILIVVAILITVFSYKTIQDQEPAVVFYVNGEPVTEVEFQEIALAAQQINPLVSDEIIRNQTILITALRQEAYKNNIEVNPLEVEIAFAQKQALLEQQLSQEQFNQALAAMNMTVEQYEVAQRAAIEDDILFQKLFELNVYPNVPNITDATALQFYRDNELSFVEEEKRIVRHILICYEGATGCTVSLLKEDAQAKAQALLAQLQDRPEDFESLANEFTTAPNQNEGGLIGEVSKGLLLPEIEDIVFNLAVGKMSQVVETEFGFHILKVDDIIPPRTVTYEEAEEEIKQRLYYRDVQQIQRDYMMDVFLSAEVTYPE
jgi:parvulin-like peptidyl-prolyl isomerase